MKLVLALACLLEVALGASLEKKPKPCKSPPLLTGEFILSQQAGDVRAYGGYEYDAFGERIRVYETGATRNQSFTYDFLFLFREGVMYQIDHKAKTCTKTRIKGRFHPIGVPPNSTLLGSAVIGGSSGPGQGLLVNTWTAPVPGKYMVTVTEFGCIPVFASYQSKDFGWAVMSYINAVRGIIKPDALNPPPFCPDQEAKPEGEPVDFFTVVRNMKNAPAVQEPNAH